jgi:ankyrin repeat protein
MKKQFLKALIGISSVVALVFVARIIISQQEKQAFKLMIQRGDIQGASRMIKSHPEYINLDLQSERRDRLKPLSVAAGLGEVDMCSNLIVLGANINEVDKYNYTPLHQTVLADQTNTAEFLIKSGANLTLKDFQGLTPLEMAERYNASRNMIILLSNAVAHK